MFRSYLIGYRRSPWNETPHGVYESPMTPQNFVEPGNDQHGLVGALLDSAGATLAITHKIHMVTGTGAVDTLTPPDTSFAGALYLIGDGTWTLTTAGNVAIACTGKANIAVGLVYNPVKGKWYPISDAVAD
jgi:hypothetical protein